MVRERNLLTWVVIMALLGAAAVMWASQAKASSGGQCDTFRRHSGYIPGSYDYALFYEDGQLVTQVETHGVNTYVNPRDYNAGSTWDKVKKCHNPETTTTTTTVPSTTSTVPATTTTVPQETTTTVPETTTTTIPETTTTVPSTTSTTVKQTTTTIGVTPTTVPEGCATQTPPTCLPFTGLDTAGYAVLGLGLIATGAYLVRRRED